mgnify:FL=1
MLSISTFPISRDQHLILCPVYNNLAIPANQGLRVTRTPLDLQVAGLTFNASELAYRCAADGKRLVEMCNDDRDEVFLDNMNAFADAMFDSVPYAYDIIPVVYAPYMRMCVPAHSTAAFHRRLRHCCPQLTPP